MTKTMLLRGYLMVWQVDTVQVVTFLFHHKLNRLDSRTSSIVLVVSPTKACILGELAAVHRQRCNTWPARAATEATRE